MCGYRQSLDLSCGSSFLRMASCRVTSWVPVCSTLTREDAQPCCACRLYFDARGETDLRLPLESSIAVIKLKDSRAANSAAEACSCSCSAAAPGATGTASREAGPGSFDLDAMGTRMLVLAPDACQTFTQKPGHYKVWEHKIWGLAQLKPVPITACLKTQHTGCLMRARCPCCRCLVA
jgi:hypothetical protein